MTKFQSVSPNNSIVSLVAADVCSTENNYPTYPVICVPAEDVSTDMSTLSNTDHSYIQATDVVAVTSAANSMILIGFTSAHLTLLMFVIATISSTLLILITHLLSAPYYSPQSGEMTKDERRALYWRKKNSALRPPPEPRPYTPQFGDFGLGNFTAVITQLSTAEKVICSPSALAVIEGFVALLVALRETASPSQFAAISVLYLKNHYNSSILTTLTAYVSELFPDYTMQSADASPDPKWFNLLRDVKSNWTRAINNEGFTRISKMLSLCVSIGLCEMSSFNFSLAGVDLFSKMAIPKHTSALDLVDAIMNTVTYFIEGGYMCFKTGSLRPLIFGDHTHDTFEKDYSRCLSCSEYVKCGNLEKFAGISENDYDHLLEKTIEKSATLMLTCRGIVEKNIMLKKKASLVLWQTNFRQSRIQGGLRMAPYSIGVFGGTSVGKSSVANIMMITTLLHNGYSAEDDRIITLNEQDKFDSNFRTYVNGVFFDDVGNTKAQYVDRAPTVKIIEYVNNVRMYATVAEAEKKGKVFIEPKVFITTKNVKDSGASTYSNEPASIARREKVTATVTVKKEYRTHDMLDQDKVTAAFPQGVPAIPDLWDIHLQTAYPFASSVKGAKAGVGWETVWFEGKWCSNIDIYTFIRYCGQDSKKFYAAQEELVSNSNNMAAKTVLCNVCNFPVSVCACHASPEEMVARSLPKPKAPFKGDGDSRPDVDSRARTGWPATHGYRPESALEFPPHWARSPYNIPDWNAPPTRMQRLHETAHRFYEDVMYRLHDWYYTVEDGYDYAYYRSMATCKTIKNQGVAEITETLEWLESSRARKWSNYVPSFMLSSPLTRGMILMSNRSELQTRVQYAFLCEFLLTVVIVFLSFYVSSFLLLALVVPIVRAASVIETQKMYLYEDLDRDRGTMPMVMKRIRDGHISYLTGICGAVGVLYLAMKLYKRWQPMTEQGNLSPRTMADIEERDLEVNPWSGVVVTPMPSTNKSKTVTSTILEKLVFKNTCFARFIAPDGRKYHCDAFFPCSNVAIIPRHIWKGSTMTTTFTRHDPTLIGGNFTAILSRCTTVDIPDTDYSVTYVPNGGDWKDLTGYLPLAPLKSCPAKLQYKDETGLIKASLAMIKPSTTNTGNGPYSSFEYTLQFPTFEGLCMSPLITQTKGPVIAGFHLGGKTGTPRGCAGAIVKSQLESAIKSLQKVETVVVGMSEGTLTGESYDVQYYQGDAVHPKSPINFLDLGANCRYHGQVIGRASYSTSIKPTCISDLVAKHTGQIQNWTGPPYHKGYPWQKSLNKSTHPGVGVDGDLLVKASLDYKEPLLNHLNTIPALKSAAKPLERMDNVCGKDGIRFIDKLVPNTSIGYPLSGPKSDHLGYLDGESDTHANPAILSEKFWEHAESMEEGYLKGERAYPLFKACFKDESTKLSATKVRVIQGAPLAFQLVVRKYYLPIARLLSVNPVLSECAVGINAHGPEWDALVKEIAKYGKSRVLAGDYKSYDLNIPAQVMFAAFGVLIDIAKECNYSTRDTTVMRGIATDICYPMIAYNGDLIQHIGSNPSGHNLTVYINCIVNSLFFRCAYFNIYKSKVNLAPFRDKCSLITYGDDAKSTVAGDCPEFNHLSVASFLAEAGMVFTMPDKTSDPTPYMEDEDADFLKRTSIYNADVDLYFGALDEMSIFKSLHSATVSSILTQDQQAAQNIDGALREWFFHGRDIYEKRRTQMRAIADEAEISYQCTLLDVNYDQQLVIWLNKYRPGDPLIDSLSVEVQPLAEPNIAPEGLKAVPLGVSHMSNEPKES